MGHETFINQVVLLWGDPSSRLLVVVILSETLIFSAVRYGLIKLDMWEEFKQDFKASIMALWKKIVK